MRACVIEPTRSKLGVLHLSVVGAAALVQPRVRGRAAVAQRAGAAAHVGVRGVEVLRTLESLVVVPVGVQPAVAVLPLRVRNAQVPGQISQQQTPQQARHPAGSVPPPTRPGGFGYRRASVPVTCSSSRSICNQRNFHPGHRHLSFPRGLTGKKGTVWIFPSRALFSALTADSNAQK